MVKFVLTGTGENVLLVALLKGRRKLTMLKQSLHFKVEENLNKEGMGGIVNKLRVQGNAQ